MLPRKLPNRNFPFYLSTGYRYIEIEIKYDPAIDTIDFFIFFLSVIGFFFGITITFFVELFTNNFKKLRLNIMFMLFLLSFVQSGMHVHHYWKDETITDIEIIHPNRIEPPSLVFSVVKSVLHSSIEFFYLDSDYKLRHMLVDNFWGTDEKENPNLHLNPNISTGTFFVEENRTYVYIKNHVTFDAQRLLQSNLPLYRVKTAFDYTITRNVFQRPQNIGNQMIVHYVEYLTESCVDCFSYSSTKEQYLYDHVQLQYEQRFGSMTRFLPRLGPFDLKRKLLNETFDQFQNNLDLLDVDLTILEKPNCQESVILIFDSGNSGSLQNINPSFNQIKLIINFKSSLPELIILILNAFAIWCNISIGNIYFSLIRVFSRKCFRFLNY